MAFNSDLNAPIRLRPTLVRDAKWYMNTRRRTGNTLNMLQLVIEEDMRAKHLEYPVLANTSKEEHFVNFNSPLAKCRHDAFVRRRATCGNNRRAQLGHIPLFFCLLLLLKALYARNLAENRASGPRFSGCVASWASVSW